MDMTAEDFRFTIRIHKGTPFLTRVHDLYEAYKCKNKSDFENLICKEPSKFIKLSSVTPNVEELFPYKDDLKIGIRREFFPEEVLVTDMEQLSSLLGEGLILDSRIKTELSQKISKVSGGFHKQDLMKVLGDVTIGEIVTGVDSFKPIDSSEVKDKLKNLNYVDDVDEMLEFIGGVKLKYLLKDMAVESVNS